MSLGYFDTSIGKSHGFHVPPRASVCALADWIVHGARSVDFIEGKIKTFLDVNLLSSNRKLLWVNPDCGLKTREWAQVRRPPNCLPAYSLSLHAH